HTCSRYLCIRAAAGYPSQEHTLPLGICVAELHLGTCLRSTHSQKVSVKRSCSRVPSQEHTLPL
ncbi:hypothetical protein NDU88_007701, partial [Pleurodeles waltl]